MAVAAGPLAGFRVVDWTQYGVGPFASSLLGALGADVIHVEAKPRGDPQQYIAPTLGGLSGMYVAYNMSKRSVMLDLRDEDDRERMWDLIRGADAMVSNFKPDSIERIGFTPEHVLACNPRIVYCVSNGWGDRGPRAGYSGGDHAVQAFCGWCSVMGEEGGSPEFLRFLGHLDLNTSYYVVAAVLTGLATRDAAGGRAVDVSMLEAALAMQSTRLSEYLQGGVLPGPLGSAASVVAPSQAFRCLDSRYLALSAETEGQWRRLCDGLGRPDLVDETRYAANADRVAHREELAAELAAVVAERPLPWWTQQLTERRVPNAAFWDFETLPFHPQLVANEHVVEVDTGRSGVVTAGGPPWRFERAVARIHRNPYPGEHTEEVLAEPAREAPRPRVAPPPFERLRVVELSTGIAGPYCGALFADQGAEVVKVEPEGGDRARGWGPPFAGGVGTAFVELNRNKALVGRGRLAELLRTADVVIADDVDADGEPQPWDLHELRRERREAIVCSISAYGERGPLAGQPGSELTVQAMSNTWAGLGRAGEAPRRLGADQASMNTGLIAYQGILAALIARERTGAGDRVEVSLLGTLLNLKGQHLTCRSQPDQWPGLHLGVWTDPPDHGIGTADRPILLTLNPRFTAPTDPARIRALVERFGGRFPDDLDLHAPWGAPEHPMHPRWHGFWTALFSGHGWEEVARVVSEHGGEVTPFMDYRALDGDPHVAELAPFAPLEDGGSGARVVRLPWRFRDSQDAPRYRVLAR